MRRWMAALMLVPLSLFFFSCNKLPDSVANADESIEILSANGTVTTGKLVTVRSSDGATRRMVVMDRTDPAARFASAPATVRTASQRTTGVSGRRVARKRSMEKSALVIGGSAGAGALVGGLAKGGKGAAIGALAGGLGGLAYDLATRNKS